MDKTIHNIGQSENRLSLLLPFIKEPWRDFTLSEIKILTKKRSHHYVYETLQEYSKTILKKEKKGNTNLYKVNEDTKEISYFILAELLLKEKNRQIPYKAICQIESKIKTSYYTLLVTGSYANNTQNKNSDLDVAIIIPGNNKKPFEIALKEGELTIPEVHGFVFTEEEFYQMLINKEFNYGKECAKNHIIIHGIGAYYKLLLRGLQNGFKG